MVINVGEFVGGKAKSFANSPHGFPASIALSQGGLARFRVFNRQAVAIADPDLARQVLIQKVSAFQRGRPARVLKLTIGEGLITTDGELWEPARQWMEPAFRRDNIISALPGIAAVIEQELNNWEQISAANGQQIELLPLLQTLIAKLSSQTLFNLKWDDETLGSFVHNIDSSLNHMARLLRRPWITPSWVPGSLTSQLRKTGQELDEILGPSLEGPATGVHGEHLLHLLASADSSEGGCPLSSRRRLNEIKTLAAAAFETSTTTLSWTIDLIARHPEIGEALRDEIDKVVGKAAPDARQLSRLSQCQQTLMESMRLWPAVYNLVREANRKVELGEHTLPMGTITIVSIYGLHRNPALWQQPDQFRPERFADHSVSHPGFIPFAIGPHTCIGKHYAILQMQCLLAMLLQRFVLSPVDGHLPKPVAKVTLRPLTSPRLFLRPRHGN
ncbi:cytochrome P450 [Cyanobium sp. HWJ4-Hawea]|uniref:cytochrome P450 n=1 Tax=Cyanobium sp. HWJ4-Hawea TaxID=2823713 RepID=UPI0020CFBF79|nr:cytochrome P450 [Cyanobium sp. HWJ4-Hawea]MCP9808957.1 cytochrome P450 [Cyanobium sp. HWJ4-Hawea]